MYDSGMGRSLLIVPAAVAAVLVFAGCSPAAEEPAPVTPTVTLAPDTGDVGTGGEVPDASAVDPGITLSDGSTIPAGIPVYAENAMSETFMPVVGGYTIAFSGTPEDIMKLLDAFKVEGFVISGSDVMVAASNPEYNVIIESDPANLPDGAAYSYTVFSN